MHGVKDRLGDLSWLGITNRAWIEVEAPEPITDQESAVKAYIQKLLQESESMVVLENSSLTKAQWQAWMDYRKKLQELHLHPEYPTNLPWPVKPE